MKEVGKAFLASLVRVDGAQLLLVEPLERLILRVRVQIARLGEHPPLTAKFPFCSFHFPTRLARCMWGYRPGEVRTLPGKPNAELRITGSIANRQKRGSRARAMPADSTAGSYGAGWNQ